MIPKVYIPAKRLCKVKDLKMNEDNVEDDTYKLREDYAKLALMMFYPYRILEDLQCCDTYWRLFTKELELHRGGKETTFWKQCFVILQNIQDRMTMDKSMTSAVDRITNNIECQTPEEEHCSMNKKPREDDMDDILLYCSEAR